MEMEVVVAVPSPVAEFNFDSTCSSPYMTAPSSPQRFGNYFLSAPTSPTRFSTSSTSDFLKDIHHSSSSSSIPFDWEEKPGTPKSRIKNVNNNNSEDFDFLENEDFEFDFSGQLDRTSLSADELFDGGKIKPLKPPPGYDSSYSNASSPKSPKLSSSPRSRNVFQKKKEFDPFQAAIEETTRRTLNNSSSNRRGRERTVSISSSSSNNKSSSNYVHKGSRSLSPLRVSDLILDDQETDKNITESVTTPKSPSYASSILSAISFSSKGYKKWKLKDLLLFRSASEGRATGKDPLTKYTVLSKRDISEDVKNASFRSTENSVGCSSRRRGPISAHELHYTANRAVSEELKRKTFLPYKQRLLGCLGFNPGVHEITRGIGSLTSGRSLIGRHIQKL